MNDLKYDWQTSIWFLTLATLSNAVVVVLLWALFLYVSTRIVVASIPDAFYSKFTISATEQPNDTKPTAPFKSIRN
jgi:hypothetical protein